MFPSRQIGILGRLGWVELQMARHGGYKSTQFLPLPCRTLSSSTALHAWLHVYFFSNHWQVGHSMVRLVSIFSPMLWDATLVYPHSAVLLSCPGDTVVLCSVLPCTLHPRLCSQITDSCTSPSPLCSQIINYCLLYVSIALPPPGFLCSFCFVSPPS